jgi:hypothetical protein
MHFKGVLRKFAAGGIVSGVVIALLVILVTPPAEQLRDFLSNLFKHEPIDMVITQAVDGNNDNVSSNGVTPSPAITFHFEPAKRDKNNNQVNLECTLDELRPFTCTDTASYSSLSKTPHVFQVKVNDPNVKASNPITFSFTVVPSITVRGVILQNNSGVRNAEVVMDNNNRRSTDDIGQFAFPFVLTREDIPHTFTILVVDEKRQKLQCENKKLLLSPIGEVASLTFKIENYQCSRAVSIAPITPYNKSDTFKPEATLGNGSIDLLYTSTLIRNPTNSSTHDGLWKINIYIDGSDLPKVSKVKYYLHPTFAPNNVVEVTSPNHPKFVLHLSAYGGFRLYAKVYCNCGGQDTVLDLSRYLIARY